MHVARRTRSALARNEFSHDQTPICPKPQGRHLRLDRQHPRTGTPAKPRCNQAHRTITQDHALLKHLNGDLMRFIDALLQVEREFNEALSALTSDAAVRSPKLRRKTRQVNRLLADIAIIRKTLGKGHPISSCKENSLWTTSSPQES